LGITCGKLFLGVGDAFWGRAGTVLRAAHVASESKRSVCHLDSARHPFVADRGADNLPGLQVDGVVQWIDGAVGITDKLFLFRHLAGLSNSIRYSSNVMGSYLNPATFIPASVNGVDFGTAHKFSVKASPFRLASTTPSFRLMRISTIIAWLSNSILILAQFSSERGLSQKLLGVGDAFRWQQDAVLRAGSTPQAASVRPNNSKGKFQGHDRSGNNRADTLDLFTSDVDRSDYHRLLGTQARKEHELHEGRTCENDGDSLRGDRQSQRTSGAQGRTGQGPRGMSV